MKKSEEFFPIRISTPAAFLRYRYELKLNCGKCERWTLADLAKLVESGRGEKELTGMRFVCRECRGPMKAIVYPPVPGR